VIEARTVPGDAPETSAAAPEAGPSFRDRAAERGILTRGSVGIGNVSGLDSGFASGAPERRVASPGIAQSLF
jgi:hypothetical protein